MMIQLVQNKKIIRILKSYYPKLIISHGSRIKLYKIV